jgi:cytidylate kinase
MTPEVQGVLQAVVQAASSGPGGGVAGTERKYVITVSRDHGTGGDEICELLAKRLKLNIYSKEILEKVTKRSHVDPAVVKALDQGVGKTRDLWLYSLLTGENASMDHYRKHMVNVILSLSRMGGIIMGRGGHVVLAKTKALRVRITGTPEICAERLAKISNINHAEAKKRIAEVNHDRGKFVWDFFQSRVNDPTAYDLVINTDRLGDYEHVVEMIVSAAQAVTEGDEV